MAGGEGWDPMAKAFIQFFLFFSLKGGVPIDCLLLILILNFWRTGADPRTAGRERTQEPQDGSGPENRRTGADPRTAWTGADPRTAYFFEDPFYFSFVVLCGMRKNIWPGSFLFAFFTDAGWLNGMTDSDAWSYFRLGSVAQQRRTAKRRVFFFETR